MNWLNEPQEIPAGVYVLTFCRWASGSGGSKHWYGKLYHETGDMQLTRILSTAEANKLNAQDNGNNYEAGEESSRFQTLSLLMDRAVEVCELNLMTYLFCLYEECADCLYGPAQDHINSLLEEGNYQDVYEVVNWHLNKPGTLEPEKRYQLDNGLIVELLEDNSLWCQVEIFSEDLKKHIVKGYDE